MAVIVTGATSFIGRAVVEELLKQGQKVYAVARPGSAGLSFLKALPLNGQEGRRDHLEEDGDSDLGGGDGLYCPSHRQRLHGSEGQLHDSEYPNGARYPSNRIGIFRCESGRNLHSVRPFCPPSAVFRQAGAGRRQRPVCG